MAKYKKVGGGSYGVYQKEGNGWAWVIGIVLFLLILAAA